MTAIELLTELVKCREGLMECSRQRQRRPWSVTRRYPPDLLATEKELKARIKVLWTEARTFVVQQKLDAARVQQGS